MPRSAASRAKLNALPVIAPTAAEAEHFLTCKACGQAIDLRNLGDVLHHEEPGHAPLASEAEPARLKFIPPQLAQRGTPRCMTRLRRLAQELLLAANGRFDG